MSVPVVERATYDEVRSQIQPGDLIAFAGKGRFSNIIKWRTRSEVSHVGAVLHRIGSGGDRVEIVESTSLYGRKGVQANALSTHLENYDGAIWWLSLEPGSIRFYDYESFMLRHLGKPYDFKQAFFSAIDWLGPLFENELDYSAFFCSELVAGAWKESGLSIGNPSEATPADLVRLQVFSRCVQLKGELVTIDPRGGG